MDEIKAVPWAEVKELVGDVWLTDGFKYMGGRGVVNL